MLRFVFVGSGGVTQGSNQHRRGNDSYQEGIHHRCISHIASCAAFLVVNSPLSYATGNFEPTNGFHSLSHKISRFHGYPINWMNPRVTLRPLIDRVLAPVWLSLDYVTSYAPPILSE